MNITPVDDDILFEFTDHVTSLGYFREKTKGGIILAESLITASSNSKYSKIGTVKHVGPKCKEVKPGMTVVIEALKWTPQFEIDGKTLWKTNETFVLGIADLES